MYKLFVSTAVYNPMYGHIIMYVVFPNSHLGHFYNIALINTEAMSILHLLPMHIDKAFHEFFFSLCLESQLILTH